MHINFVERTNGPERLVVEAELVFGDGPLAGMKLIGFSVWRGADGDLYVTFPSRAFGVGCERRHFDHVRPVEGDAKTSRRVKDWILEEYHAKAQAA